MINISIKNYYIPMPSNIYYWWNLGFLLGICLIFQIITGLFLSIFYENNMINSFERINHIERNINLGWLIRSIHANGASLFFVLIYLHIGRGLYFKSFYITTVWISGTIILLLLFITAFLGYVLPWGQIRFWGATVITNLLSSIPYVGNIITIWIWGNFSVNKATLMRFFTLHFLLPFLITFIIIIHIIFLHKNRSNNPLGSNKFIDKIPFHPYFSSKDLLRLIVVLVIILIIISIFPNMLIDPDNFSPANPIITPIHIQPEWYFLFAYAILRSIPNKLGGVIALLISILILIFLPIFYINNNSIKHNIINNFIFKIIFIIWIINFIFLTLIGRIPIEFPYEIITQIRRIIYFIFYIIFYI